MNMDHGHVTYHLPFTVVDVTKLSETETTPSVHSPLLVPEVVSAHAQSTRRHHTTRVQRKAHAQ